MLYPPDLLAEYFSGLDTRPALDVAHRVLLRILEAPQINVRTQIEAVAAMNSIEEKKLERYEMVITEYNDFTDRFSSSKYAKEAEQYYKNTLSNIKALENEQAKTTTQR